MTRTESAALVRWNTDRCAVLDSLEAIHARMTGRKRGRQHATEHFNLALFVSLAAEFQGFCRDLHDDTAIHIASSIDPGPQTPVVLNSFVRARKLDVGNASAGALGTDFGNLGMTFWPDIRARHPAMGTKWHTTIEDLNTVRNAVVHSDQAKLVEAKKKQTLHLATFRRWRSSLHGFTSGADRVVDAYLQDLTGTGWQT